MCSDTVADLQPTKHPLPLQKVSALAFEGNYSSCCELVLALRSLRFLAQDEALGDTSGDSTFHSSPARGYIACKQICTSLGTSKLMVFDLVTAATLVDVPCLEHRTSLVSSCTPGPWNWPTNSHRKVRVKGLVPGRMLNISHAYTWPRYARLFSARCLGIPDFLVSRRDMSNPVWWEKLGGLQQNFLRRSLPTPRRSAQIKKSQDDI